MCILEEWNKCSPSVSEYCLRNYRMNQIVGVSMLGAVRCPGSVCLLLVISAVENLTVPASAGPFGPVCLCECLCTVRKYFFFY